MVFKDFKIGDHFWTASGRWLCTDLGTRCVVAYLVSYKDLFKASNDSWDLQENIVFYPYDFGGCSKTDTFTTQCGAV
jgi:hypothetical protein